MSAGEWWREGVIYQVYPRSFQDSNADGIGDLRGGVHRRDYLQWLGVDAIWLNPITVSPDADVGYDVADYCGVQPVFGARGTVGPVVVPAIGGAIVISTTRSRDGERIDGGLVLSPWEGAVCSSAST